jgi:hypothetical protein
MNKLKTALRTAAATGILATALAVVPAVPAQAVPTGCSGGYDVEYFNTWAVYCGGSGNGQYRAKARCYKTGHTTYVTRYGAWKYARTDLSTVFCQSGEEVASGTWELKD